MKFFLRSIVAVVIGMTTFLAQAAPPVPEKNQSLDDSGIVPLIERLPRKIILPKVDFQDSSLAEAVEFLAGRSRALDPDGLGINILLKESPRKPSDKGHRVNMKAQEITLRKALEDLATLSEYRLRLDPYAILLIDPQSPDGRPHAPRPEIRKIHGGMSIKMGRALAEITMPRLELDSSSVRESLQFVRERSKALSPTDEVANIIFQSDDEEKLPKITLKLRNVPVIEAIRYIAELADLEVSADQTAIYIGSPKVK